MSVLPRPARSRAGTRPDSPATGSAPTGTAPATSPAGIPAPRGTWHDQDVAAADRPAEGARRRVALVLAGLVLAIAAAVGAAVVIATDGQEPTVVAPGVSSASIESEAKRDAAAQRRYLSSDGSRAGQAQLDAASGGQPAG